MTTDVIKYKEYIGSVHYSEPDNSFFGKIEGINDMISFEGKSVNKLKKSFEEAVDDYIELCKITGKNPMKSYKGSFNVRVNPDLHKKAVEKSLILGISLNQLIQKAIENELESMS